ncbi:hypothetical protein RvY_03716-2 [Ramazzottius varieornatus]|uniref:Uncharacterized protein n=1 Tax=Ramazzottius varieornatus TaxID=947166 RepID=A0A1D1USQ4_RAMVA|nr:hypothetical protein RvY_03716-2 [Ramazzottius varieornatus]
MATAIDDTSPFLGGSGTPPPSPTTKDTAVQVVCWAVGSAVWEVLAVVSAVAVSVAEGSVTADSVEVTVDTEAAVTVVTVGREDTEGKVDTEEVITAAVVMAVETTEPEEVWVEDMGDIETLIFRLLLRAVFLCSVKLSSNAYVLLSSPPTLIILLSMQFSM